MMRAQPEASVSSAKGQVPLSFNPQIAPRDRVLLALRAGPLDSGQLEERIGYAYYPAVKGLLRDGLATYVNVGAGSVYRLTRAGVAACPRRRDLETRAL
jgi:hypothetical protein